MMSLFPSNDCFRQEAARALKALTSSHSRQEINDSGETFFSWGNEPCVRGENNTNETTGDVTGLQLTGGMDNQIWYWTDAIVFCGLQTAIVLFGIFTNILSLMALSRNTIFNNSSNTLLLHLTVADLMLLITFVLSLRCFYPDTTDTKTKQYLLNTIERILFNPKNVLGLSSLNVTAVIAVERVCVLVPFRVARIFTPRKTKTFSACAASIPVLLIIPFYVLSDIEWAYEQEKDLYVITNWNIRLNHRPIMIFFMWTTNACIILATLVVFVCSGITCWKILDQARRRNSMLTAAALTQGTVPGGTRRQAQQAQAVVVLFLICAVAFLVSATSLILKIYIQYNVNGRPEEQHLSYLFKRVNKFLLSVNSSINFLFYFFLSTKFAHSYKNLFKCRIETGRKTKSGGGRQ